jgi:hypothetical protein
VLSVVSFDGGVLGHKVNARFLEQSLRLGIVLGLDLVVVEEVLLGRGEVVELEAVAVEIVLVCLAAYIVDGHFDWVDGSLVGLRLADVRRMRWASILIWLVVVQDGADVMLGHTGLNGSKRLKGGGMSTGGLIDCC